MGLSDDQKAMLRLLAQREEGYEDMAKLMGISVDEVRERVKEALAEVNEPAAAPTAPEPPAPEPRPTPPVTEPTVPATPPTQAPPTAAEPRAKRPKPQIPSLNLPKDRGALVGLGAGVLVLIALAIVLLVSGGDGETGSNAAEGQSTELTAAEERDLTQAVLAPTGDTDASGRALFGRYKRNVLLQVEAEGLDPSPQGESYTVWLYRSPKLALQIGAVRVGEDGRIAAQFQIPAQLLNYVANGAFDQIDVSLTSTAEYKAAFNKAKSENRVPPYIGESVLRGEITGPAIR